MNIIYMNAACAAEAVCYESGVFSSGIPVGFLASQGGIYEETEDGSADPAWLCSSVWVKSVFRNTSGAGWGRIITVVNPEGVEQDVALLNSEIERSRSLVLGRLTDCGLRLRSGTKARDAFMSLIKEWSPDAMLTSTDRLGWNDASCAAFVLGDGRVIGNGKFHFTGRTPAGADGIHAPAGTVDGWRENVAALCIGNPLMTLSVSLAFTGPLLELLNEEGGGLHLHGASSCGKTTLQRLATSVWRDPAHVGSWRVTANGAEDLARACNSMLLPLDEIAEISGKDLDQAAYMLANGTGKVRADAQGSSKPPARWRVAILSTGEISVADKIAEAGRHIMAGQAVRLLDIDAESGRYGAFDNLHKSDSAADFADCLKRASMEHHGTAGPAFVERLIANKANVSMKLGKLVERFVQRLERQFLIGQDGQALRVARRLAVIAGAGELATKFGLTGWSNGDAIIAATKAMELWVDARSNGKPVVDAEALERTRLFLTDHTEEFAGPAGNDSPTPSATHGWKHAGLFYIRKESWLALHGEAATDVAKGLAVMGMLLPGDGKNLARKTPRWVEARPRTYTIREQILEEGHSLNSG